MLLYFIIFFSILSLSLSGQPIVDKYALRWWEQTKRPLKTLFDPYFKVTFYAYIFTLIFRFFKLSHNISFIQIKFFTLHRSFYSLNFSSSYLSFHLLINGIKVSMHYSNLLDFALSHFSIFISKTIS